MATHLPEPEAALLDLLIRNPGRVVSTTELLAITGQSSATAPWLARSMRRLTHRLDVDPLLPRLIEPVGVRTATA